MKKLLAFVFAVLFLSQTLTCFAGDVPEALLFEDSSQVYFAQVKSINNNRITVVQKQNIKGDFSENSELTYPAFVFSGSPEIGKVYLCGYIDENNPLYIWKVTSLETKYLKIESNDSFSKRMQKYLNQGKFEETNSKLNSSIKTSNSATTNAAKETGAVNAERVATNLCIVISSALTLVLVLLFIQKSLKSKYG